MLRLASTAAAVMVIGFAAMVGTSALKATREWWATALGVLLAVIMVGVGYRLARSGNFMALYGS